MKQPLTEHLIFFYWNNSERHLVLYSQISFDVSRQTWKNNWVKCTNITCAIFGLRHSQGALPTLKYCLFSIFMICCRKDLVVYRWVWAFHTGGQQLCYLMCYFVKGCGAQSVQSWAEIETWGSKLASFSSSNMSCLVSHPTLLLFNLHWIVAHYLFIICAPSLSTQI